MRTPTITSPYTESEFNELLAEYHQKQTRAKQNILYLILGDLICVLALLPALSISGNLHVLALVIVGSVCFGLTALLDKKKKAMPIVCISRADEKEMYQRVNCAQDKAAAQFVLQIYQQKREISQDEFQVLCMHLSEIPQRQNYETQLHNLQSIIDAK